jgi:hypothetical protein
MLDVLGKDIKKQGGFSHAGGAFDIRVLGLVNGKWEAGDVISSNFEYVSRSSLRSSQNWITAGERSDPR